MALIVKAWLMKRGGDNQSSEVRIFTAEPSETENYAAFASKINELFPALSGKIFNIYWKDEENDEVSISTNQELADALGCAQSGVFRVIIKPRDGDQTNNKDIHPNVICDGCESGVRGTRYKCCVCVDYDLCESCESQGVHQMHDMIAIRNPRLTRCRSPNNINILLPFPGANRLFGCSGVRGSRRGLQRPHNVKGPYPFKRSCVSTGTRTRPGHQEGHGHRRSHGPCGPHVWHGPHKHHGPHGSWGPHDYHGPSGPLGEPDTYGPWGPNNHHEPHGLFGPHAPHGIHGQWGSHCPCSTSAETGDCHTGGNCSMMCDLNDEDGTTSDETETPDEQNKTEKCQTTETRHDVGRVDVEQLLENPVVSILEPVGVLFEMDVDDDSDINSCQELPSDRHTREADKKQSSGSEKTSDHPHQTQKSGQDKSEPPSTATNNLYTEESAPILQEVEQETGEKAAVAEGATSCGDVSTRTETGGIDAMDTDRHPQVVKRLDDVRSKLGSKTSGK